MKFETLTPRKDVDKIKVYEKAIDFAVESEEIRNVAITGIYGSGKTSIIETYKNSESFKFKLATLFFSVLPTNLTSFIAPSVLDNKLRHGSLLVNRALASFLAIKSYRVRLGIKH